MTNPAPIAVRFGKGEDTVLFLHGWNQNVTSLSPLAEILADLSEGRATCIVTEFPGFGGTPRPPNTWGVDEYRDWTESLLQELGVSSVSIVGHSFGGKVAVALAAKNRSLVKRLVLIGASGVRTPKNFSKTVRGHMLRVLRSVIKMLDSLCGTEIFRSWFVPRFASRDYLQAGELRDTFVKVVNQFIEDDARKVSAHTLLLWGDCDEESPPEAGRTFRRLMGNSSLILLPFRGHFPFEGAAGHLIAFYIGKFLGFRGGRR